MEKPEQVTVITDEVSTLLDCIHLIRINGAIIGFVNDESAAIPIINTLAETEIKRLQRPGLKILRQNFAEGKEVHICTQSLGTMWNGKLKKTVIIDMGSAPKLKYTGPQ